MGVFCTRQVEMMGTLKTLVKIAYDVCSTQELLQKELNYIEKVFRVNSNYPIWES